MPQEVPGKHVPTDSLEEGGEEGLSLLSKHRNMNWFIARCPGVTRQLPEGSNLTKAEKNKVSVWAKIEHLFCTIKREFGYAKVH